MQSAQKTRQERKAEHARRMAMKKEARRALDRHFEANNAALSGLKASIRANVLRQHPGASPADIGAAVEAEFHEVMRATLAGGEYTSGDGMVFTAKPLADTFKQISPDGRKVTVDELHAALVRNARADIAARARTGRRRKRSTRRSSRSRRSCGRTCTTWPPPSTASCRWPRPSTTARRPCGKGGSGWRDCCRGRGRPRAGLRCAPSARPSQTRWWPTTPASTRWRACWSTVMASESGRARLSAAYDRIECAQRLLREREREE